MDQIRVAIAEALRNDSELMNLATGVHYAQADEGDQPPYVIFQQMSGMPALRAMDAHDYDNDIWMVKGVGAAADAEDLNERCFALLHDQDLSIAGKQLHYLRRESDVPGYYETVGGERFDHVGTMYRLVSSEAS